MKAVITLLIIAGLIAGTYFLYKEVFAFDPTAQGEAARKAITPGISLKKVFDIAGENCNYRGVTIQKKRSGKGWAEAPVMGQGVPLDKKKLENRIANKEVPYGFALAYEFSGKCAFDVHFDKTGTVTAVTEKQTLSQVTDRLLGDE